MINNIGWLEQMLMASVSQLPVFLVSFAACTVVVLRWKELSRCAVWALIGFGLSTALCLIIPIAQSFLQRMAYANPGYLPGRSSLFSLMNMAWSILRALSYAFLLAAVLDGRGRSGPAPQSRS